MKNLNGENLNKLKKEFERVLLEYLEQDFPPQTGYLLGGQEWWRQKFGMDNRLWSWFEQQLIAHDKQMVKKIKEEFKKIWLKWHGCGQKQCEGCEYDFDFEWQEVSKLFDEARKEEREEVTKELCESAVNKMSPDYLPNWKGVFSTNLGHDPNNPFPLDKKK